MIEWWEPDHRCLWCGESFDVKQRHKFCSLKCCRAASNGAKSVRHSEKRVREQTEIRVAALRVDVRKAVIG